MDQDDTAKILTPGQLVLDRFLLVRRIGRGGMGIVWLAEDKTLQLDVALKMLPDLLRSDPAALDDLKSEARKSLLLAHPNIVRIHDFIESPEAAGISMEYIDGKTLAELRLKQPGKVFETHELAGSVAQLCDAMIYAHTDAKLVHRDLKPGNLMIDSNGRLKVADFGISRSLQDTLTRVTKGNVVAGTLAYMSPQQLYGEKPDPRDDIYSLGATLYDLVTGKPPFHSGDITAQIEERTPPLVTERRREFENSDVEVPEEWETTIAACLEKDPAKRPQSAAEVAMRLNLPHTSHSYITWSGSSRAEGIGKQPLLFAAVLCLTLAGFLAAQLGVFGSRPGPATSAIFVSGNEDSVSEDGPVRALVDLLADRDRLSFPTLPGMEGGARYTNSLGMILLPVGSLYCSIWETRVGDYRAFVDSSGYEPHPGDIRVMTERGWEAAPARSWSDPGFEQTPDHPVCGVNVVDALRFCAWLTTTEQTAGRLKENQYYRLPYDDEWARIAGPHDRPWAPGLKPQGNYAGNEAAAAPGWQSGRSVFGDIDDGFPRTAPVGLFLPNEHGVFDLGGNLWEWCLEPLATMKAHLRGGSWDTENEEYLLIASRVNIPAQIRNTSIGFRVVLVEAGGSLSPPKE